MKSVNTTPRQTLTKDGVGRGKKDGLTRKPLSEVVCFKCHKTGHFQRSCTEKNLRVQEGQEEVKFFGKGEINRRPVKRIQIDSGASRTIVNRRLVSEEDIGRETIRVTFGNGATGEYPLADVRMRFDEDEYYIRAAVVQDLAEEVLLGRDVLLHKHIVCQLPETDQMALLQQLARAHGVEISKDYVALAVTTRAQSRTKKNQEEQKWKNKEEQTQKNQEEQTQKNQEEQKWKNKEEQTQKNQEEQNQEKQTQKNQEEQTQKNQEEQTQRNQEEQTQENQEEQNQEEQTQENQEEQNQEEQTQKNQEEQTQRNQKKQTQKNQEEQNQEKQTQKNQEEQTQKNQEEQTQRNREEQTQRNQEEQTQKNQEEQTQENQEEKNQEEQTQENQEDQNQEEQTQKDQEEAWGEFPFNEELFGQSKARIRQTRAERREQSIQWN